MKYILIDCDNTMGIPHCDIDDALAILYILGHPEANCVGITATYGNNSTDKVYECTANLLRNLHFTDIPLIKGEKDALSRSSRAGAFLNHQADQYGGSLSILATGSLTNLLAAYELDPYFFDKVSEIDLMGGITQPLMVNGRKMDELNFSCDPRAAEVVLTKGRNVSVVTGNQCIDAYFYRKDYDRLLHQNPKLGRYLAQQTAYWFAYYEKNYGMDGFIAWDVIAAIYMMEEGLYDPGCQRCQVSEKNLRQGWLPACETCGTKLKFPIIKSWDAVKTEMINKWINIGGNHVNQK